MGVCVCVCVVFLSCFVELSPLSLVRLWRCADILEFIFYLPWFALSTEMSSIQFQSNQQRNGKCCWAKEAAQIAKQNPHCINMIRIFGALMAKTLLEWEFEWTEYQRSYPISKCKTANLVTLSILGSGDAIKVIVVI